MDALTFIEKIVGSAIWPVTVLTIVLILKRPIISLLTRLRKFKSKEVEVELGADFEAIEKAAKDQIEAGSEVADEQADRYARLLKSSPKTVIVENWKRIEKSASQVLLNLRVEISDEDFKRPMMLVEKLLVHEIVDEETHALIRNMLILRNKVVHYEPLRIKAKDAKAYYENSVLILKKLRALDDKLRF
jgi:uncharacterized protein YutE (UPF0331/DUF86 family)